MFHRYIVNFYLTTEVSTIQYLYVHGLGANSPSYFAYHSQDYQWAEWGTKIGFTCQVPTEVRNLDEGKSDLH